VKVNGLDDQQQPETSASQEGSLWANLLTIEIDKIKKNKK
jgi:hypothetical protein